MRNTHTNCRTANDCLTHMQAIQAVFQVLWILTRVIGSVHLTNLSWANLISSARLNKIKWMHNSWQSSIFASTMSTLVLRRTRSLWNRFYWFDLHKFVSSWPKNCAENRLMLFHCASRHIFSNTLFSWYDDMAKLELKYILYSGCFSLILLPLAIAEDGWSWFRRIAFMPVQIWI